MTDQISTAEQPTGTVTSAEATLLQTQPQPTPQHQQQPQQQPQPTPPHQQQSQQQPQSLDPQKAAGFRDTDRLANWLLGVEPQDVRFPVNIAQLAFTANYFAALTSDRRKIYVNRRVPGWRGNCKRRCIDFPAEQRPSSVVSFDHCDTLCVVFRRRIEFYSLATVARVGAYETATAEIAAAGARGGRAPLGALWCASPASRQAAPQSGTTSAEAAAFTVWTDRTDAPKRALLLGPSAVGRQERFLCFYWTSEDTVLLVSRREEPEPMSAEQPQRYLQQGRPHQPLVFCAYDTAGRRPVQRLCRRSVHSARQFCLSPDGCLLLLSGGSRHQLLEATTLRQLLALPRRQAATVAAPLPMAVTNCGDLLLLQMTDSAGGGAALEVHRRGSGPGCPARYELAKLLGFGGGGDCRVYGVGELGALIVFEQEGGGAGSDGGGFELGGGGEGRGREAGGDRPGLGQQEQEQQSRSIVALVDLNGNLIMRAEWPRSHIHLVSDDLLVHLRRLSSKPFSAAHACIFDFNSPVTRRSHWAAAAVTATAATAAAAAASPAANFSAPTGAHTA